MLFIRSCDVTDERLYRPTSRYKAFGVLPLTAHLIGKLVIASLIPPYEATYGCGRGVSGRAVD